MEPQFPRHSTQPSDQTATDAKIENADLRAMQVTERSFKIKDEVKKFTVTEPCSNIATDILPTESSEKLNSPTRYQIPVDLTRLEKQKSYIKEEVQDEKNEEKVASVKSEEKIEEKPVYSHKLPHEVVHEEGTWYFKAPTDLDSRQ